MKRKFYEIQNCYRDKNVQFISANFHGCPGVDSQQKHFLILEANYRSRVLLMFENCCANLKTSQTAWSGL